MSDEIALHSESEESPAIFIPAKPLYIQFARCISTLFSPVTISFPFILLVALYHNEPAALQFSLIALLFLSIGPLLYIAIGVSLGKFTDLDVSVRTQRTGPLLFSVVSSLLGFAVFFVLHAPKDLVTILLISTISNTIMLITTFWWKISMHAASISGVATMLTILYGTYVLPAFLLVGLVCWSRVVLKRHTLAQVMAGALMSLILTSLVLVVRGV